MSYPLHRAVSGSTSRHTLEQSGFWGLDASANAMGRGWDTAMDTQNLIWAGEGLQKRKGYALLSSLGAPINGIFPTAAFLLVHAGDTLYRVTSSGNATKLGSGLNDAPSRGVFHRQALTLRRLEDAATCYWTRQQEEKEYLFLNDGVRYWVCHSTGVFPAADDAEGATFYATVPFTTVAKLPQGSGGDADPKGANRLSLFRCESFYVDSMDDVTRFVLNMNNRKVLHTLPPEVQLRDSNGQWRCLRSSSVRFENLGRSKVEEVLTPTIVGGCSIKTDSEGCVVAVGEGALHMADDGMDNVRITYAVAKDAPEELNTATAQGVYGADGAQDVLFLGGSTATPGVDYFSAAGDFLCFYEASAEVVGNPNREVTGYARLSDGRMAVLKAGGGEASVYFRTHRVAEVGSTLSGEPYLLDAYPSEAGAMVEGCLHSFGLANIGNEPCFLAQDGLYAVRSVSDELTNLDQVVRRSGEIDPLLQEAALSEARLVRWERYALLLLGNEVLITDGALRRGSLRFLRWVLGHRMVVAATRGEMLWFGDAEGHLYRFGEGDQDDTLPILAYWKTPLLEAGGGRRILLRRMLAAACPAYEGYMEAVMEAERTPYRPRRVPLGRLDFGAVDFGSLPLEGSAEVRWVPLLGGTVAGESLSLRLELSEGVTLWGLRAVYEKGGLGR